MRTINLAGKCKRCGKRLPEGSRSDKLFCSTACRVGTHRSTKGRQQVTYDCYCHWCGRPFKAVSYWRKYCPGDKCKQAAYRARSGAGKQAMF